MNAGKSKEKNSTTQTNVHAQWIALTDDIVPHKKNSVFWENSGMS